MSSGMREPILLGQLRTALSHLYSLNNISNSSNQHEAHSYLIEFQSRNIRRKVTSLFQRKRDLSNQQDFSTKLESDCNNNGSSIYASLPFLLYSTPSHDTERLFCAQTLLHRLRRMKTSEAIDFEMEFFESPLNVNVLAEVVLHQQNQPANQSASHYWTEFVKFHGEQLSLFHTNLLGKVLQNFFQNLSTGGMIACQSDIEEKVKGEITLLILATAAYLNAYAHGAGVAAGGVDGTHVRPILDTISSAMAVVALRLRYTSASLLGSNCPASDTPIVTQMIQAFQSVSEFASPQQHYDLLPHLTVNESTSHLICQQNESLHQMALSQCMCVSLASIPDALLGGGGARGRLSIDPKCIMAANTEFRRNDTGVGLLKEAFMYLLELAKSRNQEGALFMQQQILIASERWARFVPLPLDFVEYTVSSIMPNVSKGGTELNSFDKQFCAYLIRIYEGASMSVEQTIASAAGLIAEGNTAGHQPGRKRQSSKSKKRHKERLQEVVNGDDLKQQEAEAELKLRGLVACHAAMWTWDCINNLFLTNLKVMDASLHSIVEGEGPIGCICTSVSACLPYLISNGSFSEDPTHSKTLFQVVSRALQQICSSDNRSVRGLAYEHIAVVHTALTNNSSSTQLNETEMLIIQNICECTFVMANKCTYPNEYFVDLALNNDEELEVERNDVRDLLRSVCSLESKSPHISMIILDQTVQHCAHNVSDQNAEGLLPPESLIHMLSAPAKSFHRLAKTLQDSGNNVQVAEKIIRSTLDCLTVYCKKLLEAFMQSLPLKETLPIARLVCITVASFAPFFNAMVAAANVLNTELKEKVQHCLGVAVLAVEGSISRIPELIASSTLDNTRFDIRGTMRPPGGEDHCGCIAFMRVVKSSEILAQAALECAAQVRNSNIVSEFTELANVYAGLHKSETERPPGQLHGIGVTPKSRRILLTAMAKIGLVIIRAHPDTQDAISSELMTLFRKPVDAIISCQERNDINDAQKLFLLCEACFDLSAFPPLICKELFVVNGYCTKATEVLVQTCVAGFSYNGNGEEPSESMIQWGRLRGAVGLLLRSCANPGLSDFSIEATIALVNAECKAVIDHCEHNRNEPHSIFHELVISEDMSPGGTFIINVRDIVENLRSTFKDSANERSDVISSASSCLSVLSGCKDSVFAAVGSRTTIDLTEWEDPRTTTLEAWLLAINELMKLNTEIPIEDQLLQQLGCETLALSIQILMHKHGDKEKQSPGQGFVLSLDGPQTLAMVEFLELIFQFGHSVFPSVAKLLPYTHFEAVNREMSDVGLIGGGIITAAIYRCASGSVPPWAIEYVPNILKALSNACGHQAEPFLAILFAGADLKLKQGCTFGCIQSGRHLSGHYYDTMKPRAKEDFIRKANDICACVDNTKWRKLKVMIKAVCGGKKKASDFNLKPSFTNWECDRI